MWHVKTKLGTFWIVESDADAQKYYLGCEEEDLGSYDSIKKAVEDVCNHETGNLSWDEQITVKAPEAIEQWEEGPPDGW